MVNTNDVVTISFASGVWGVGATLQDFDLIVQDVATSAFVLNRSSMFSERNVSVQITAGGPATWRGVLMGGGGPAHNVYGELFGYELFLAQVSLQRCQYGTELKPLGTFVYYLTPGLIDVWLTTVALPWLAPIFTALYFTTFNAQTLCGSLPPPLPVIDLTTLQATATTVFQILEAIAWPNVCQCKPGTPAPEPPPPPVAVQPIGWPVRPIFSCDPADVCAALVNIQTMISELQTSIGADLGLATLTQRYGLPFAYITGATHGGLTGTASFAVSRLVGVRVSVTAWPSSNRTFTGDPAYISDLGWISVLTGDGLIDEIRLTRFSQTWVPRLMPLATLLGFALREGVTVDITELEAEP